MAWAAGECKRFHRRLVLCPIKNALEVVDCGAEKNLLTWTWIEHTVFVPTTIIRSYEVNYARGGGKANMCEPPGREAHT